MTTRIALFLNLTFLIPFPAATQGGWVAMTVDPPSPTKVVKGRPYSYELVSQTKQIMLDGRALRPEMSTKVFQDSAGRRRTERPVVTSFPVRSDDVALVEIYDGVAGYRYVLDAGNKVAHRSAIPRLTQRGLTSAAVAPSDIASAASNSGGGHRAHENAFSLSLPGGGCGDIPCSSGELMEAAPPRLTYARPSPESMGKSLGTREIEGLKCEGWLRKSAAGITETWISKDLQIVVLSKSSDPRTGESKIRNLSRAEPDASLFQPPADYKVVDETGPFRLKISLP